MTTERSQVAVALSELARCKADIASLGQRVDALEEKLGLLRSDLRVLEQRVASYAAFGAVIGGGASSLITMAIGKFLGL